MVSGPARRFRPSSARSFGRFERVSRRQAESTIAVHSGTARKCWLHPVNGTSVIGPKAQSCLSIVGKSVSRRKAGRRAPGRRRRGARAPLAPGLVAALDRACGPLHHPDRPDLTRSARLPWLVSRTCRVPSHPRKAPASGAGQDDALDGEESLVDLPERYFDGVKPGCRTARDPRACRRVARLRPSACRRVVLPRPRARLARPREHQAPARRRESQPPDRLSDSVHQTLRPFHCPRFRSRAAYDVQSSSGVQPSLYSHTLREPSPSSRTSPEWEMLFSRCSVGARLSNSATIRRYRRSRISTRRPTTCIQ